MAESSTSAATRESASPPPLPKEPILTSNEAVPVDQPIDSLGDDDEDEQPAEDGPAAEEAQAGGESGEEDLPVKKRKGKGKAANEGSSGTTKVEAASEAQPWQAVWAPEQNGRSSSILHETRSSLQRGTFGILLREQ